MNLKRSPQVQVHPTAKFRWSATCLVAGSLLVWAAAGVTQTIDKDGEWPTYAADLKGTRYRPLDQIKASGALQRPRSGMAVQDRQPGLAAGIQTGRHPAHGERDVVCARREHAGR